MEFTESQLRRVAQEIADSFKGQIRDLQKVNGRIAVELRATQSRLARYQELMAEDIMETGVTVLPPPRSVMVGLWVPFDVAQMFEVQDGVDASTMHLTLCFLGPEDLFDDLRIGELRNVVEGFAQTYPVINGTISGIGRFCPEMDGEKDVFYLSYDSPQLEDLKSELQEALERANFYGYQTHGFTPHITVAYIPRSTPTPMQSIDPTTITFPALSLAVGSSSLAGDRWDFPLLGSKSSTDDSDPWQGEGMAV